MPPKSPVKASTKSMTTFYRGFGPKGKEHLVKVTAKQYTPKPKDGRSKSGVVWNALETAKGMPAGPGGNKRQKAIAMLTRAYHAEQDIEGAERDRAFKAYLKREREREIKTYNRDRKK